MNKIINSKIWGHIVWYYMHAVSFSLVDPIPKEIVASFYLVLKYLLPCGICRRHYQRKLYNVRFTNSKQISTWLFNIHNEINRGLKKPIISYQKAIDIHKKLDHKKLIRFYEIILLQSTDKKIEHRLLFAKSAVLLFPCLNCRKEFEPLLKDLKGTEADFKKLYNALSKKIDLKTKDNQK